MFPFLFLILLFTIPLQAATDVSKDPAWLRLMHFKNEWGTFQSQIDSPGFFLAPNGKKDAKAEAEAFLAIASSEPIDLPEQKSVQCRFPARAAYLKRKFPEQVKSWPSRSCPDFQRWFETLRGVSVSLVFSSYYLNNPASTFGHTFLRINKAPSSVSGKRYELLDYGINYAANPTTNNAILYPLMGLMGGFAGNFTTTPYYYKVREYNNAESRDLWEYELSLTPAQVDLLVAHLWELGSNWANYFYLTENCSYYVLTLLEAADPKLELTSHLKTDVIPQDTVQIVWNTPGLVKSVNYRASTRVELMTRLKDLSAAEKTWVANHVKKLQLQNLDQFSPDRRRLVLDAAIDFTDSRYPVEVQVRESDAAKFKTQLLIERSQIDEVSERLQIEVPEASAPHLGHGSRRAGLGYLHDNQRGDGQIFSYRFALHDFLDPVIGYPESAKIVFFDFRFQHFNRSRRFELEQATLFEVQSLNPITEFSTAPSWGLAIGYEKLNTEDCLDCAGAFGKGRLGVGAHLWSTGILASAGVRAASFYTGKRFYLGAGPEAILQMRWNSKWSTNFEGWLRFDHDVNHSQFRELQLATQYSPNADWGWRVKGTDRWFEKQGSLEIFYYY